MKSSSLYFFVFLAIFLCSSGTITWACRWVGDCEVNNCPSCGILGGFFSSEAPVVGCKDGQCVCHCEERFETR